MTMVRNSKEINMEQSFVPKDILRCFLYTSSAKGIFSLTVSCRLFHDICTERMLASLQTTLRRFTETRETGSHIQTVTRGFHLPNGMRIGSCELVERWHHSSRSAMREAHSRYSYVPEEHLTVKHGLEIHWYYGDYAYHIKWNRGVIIYEGRK